MNTESLTARPIDLHAWDEAFRRVESYLRAHGVESRVQLNALTTEIIAAAQRSSGDRAGAEPVTLAMAEANARIEAWLERVFGPGTSRERLQARGRLALIMTDFPARWAQYFLSEGELPKELLAAVAATGMQAGPEVRFTNMAPQPIEFGSPPKGGGPRPSLPRSAMLRAAAMWVLIIGLLGVTWAASH